MINRIVYAKQGFDTMLTRNFNGGTTRTQKDKHIMNKKVLYFVECKVSTNPYRGAWSRSSADQSSQIVSNTYIFER
jgi:hypothetical protein